MKIAAGGRDLPDRIGVRWSVTHAETQLASVGRPSTGTWYFARDSQELAGFASIASSEIEIGLYNVGNLSSVGRWVDVVRANVTQAARRPTGQRNKPIRKGIGSIVAANEEFRPARRNIIK